MRLDLPELLPLICPACAARTGDRIELRSLEVVSRALAAAGELIEGVLRCTGCDRRYPVIDGAPVVMRDLGAFLGGAGAALLQRDASPEVLGALAEAGTDDSPLSQQAALRSSYLDASWGDRAEPRPDGPAGVFGFSALAEKLAARAAVKVDRAVELGCGVGRGLSILSRGAALAVGVDASPWALRCARRLLAGQQLAYGRRDSGRTYSRAVIDPGAPAGPGGARPPSDSLAAPGVQLLCADVLSPPLAPGTFDRVAALNVLDAVSSPRLLLDVAASLLAPGGELLLCAPYAWKSGITDEGHRLGPDPEAALREGLHARGLLIEDEDLHVPWLLRRDARAASLYDTHWVRARKPA